MRIVCVMCLALLSCGSKISVDECDPGDRRDCTCTSGASGEQECVDDGWGPCECAPEDAGVDGDAAGEPGEDADTDPDAPAGLAAHLGRPCTPEDLCPDGYFCMMFPTIGSTEEGFCTLSCGGSDDTTTCSDGFPGPGEPRCILSETGGGAPDTCGILCPEGDCPEGLGCFDIGAGDGICAGDEGT